jgi:hypothetical protein
MRGRARGLCLLVAVEAGIIREAQVRVVEGVDGVYDENKGVSCCWLVVDQGSGYEGGKGQSCFLALGWLCLRQRRRLDINIRKWIGQRIFRGMDFLCKSMREET